MKKPYIKVDYTDNPINNTSERKSYLKSYFANKYKTDIERVKINFISAIKPVTSTDSNNVNDISSITQQRELMKKYVELNNIDVDFSKVLRLDEKVNKDLSINERQRNDYKINKIEFTNFLSFGNDNVIDYSEMNGITIVESNPKNYGGKTTAFIDLLMFAFYGETTKTKTLAEIFNKYTNEDIVKVKVYMSINDVEYIISKMLIRKYSKSGEPKITSEVDYYRIENGDVINENDEQRKYTEKAISDAIGSKEDFLTTILCTGNNLEDLIDSKPTARGNILIKFLGLDLISSKENTAKLIKNEWEKKKISNYTNIPTLELTIENSNKTISESKIKIQEIENKLILSKAEFKELSDKKDGLLQSLISIDDNISKLNINLLNTEKNELENLIYKSEKEINEIVIPNLKNEFFDDTELNKLKSDLFTKEHEIKFNNIAIDANAKSINSLIESDICPTCKRKLENDTEHRDEEIKSLESRNDTLKQAIEALEKELITISERIDVLTKESEDYKQRDSLILIKTRHELTLKENKMKYDSIVENIEKYEKNKKIIEDNAVIQMNILSLSSQLETKQNGIYLMMQESSQLSSNIELLEKTIVESNETIRKIRVEEDTQKIFNVYLQIFGKNGISKMIMRDIIPVLNEELKYLLSDSALFYVELDINEKNEIEFNMVDEDTLVTKSLSSASGYEKTIASLALRSVLAKISNLSKPNFLVMDEIFGKVADENIELIGEFFIKLKRYFETIILISHNGLVKNWADHVVKIEKENNISNIKNN